MDRSSEQNPAVAALSSAANGAFDVTAFAATHGGVRRFKAAAGTRLFSQHEIADCAFYIEDGQVELAVVSARGKDAILGILSSGKFVGATCLIETWRATAARCLTDGTIVRIERANLLAAIRTDRAFAGFFLVQLLERIGRMRGRLISLLFDTSEQRLARILLALADYGNGGEGEGGTVINKLDQETLAQMVGTTRARISHFLNKFHRMGHIEYNNNIIVRRSLANVVPNDISVTAAATPDEGLPTI